VGESVSSCVELAARTVALHGMIQPGERVLAAVSGGPDSMALWHILRALGYAIEVACFDHDTRAGQSAEDTAFVRGQARRLEAPFHTERRPVAEEARRAGLGFEAYARQVRYAFLTRVARERGCAVVATGHTADDQAETVLMRLIRGAAPEGAAGIPPVREDGGVRIVRPLLACWRDALRTYLEAQSIPYRIDASNTDPRFLRNRVRAELLPLLRDQYNPRVQEALVRFAEVARPETDLLAELAAEGHGLCVTPDRAVDRAAFRAIHPALQRRVVLLEARRQGVDCPFDRVDAVVRFLTDAPAGAAIDLGGGVMWRAGRDLAEPVVESQGRDEPDEAILTVPGVTRAFGKVFAIRCLDDPPTGDLAAYCHPGLQVFDADALGAVLAVRRKRPGDRFTPLGMAGSKKLKDHFADLGIPSARRDRELVLLAKEVIVWIVGRACAAQGAVTPQTRRTIEVCVTDATE